MIQVENATDYGLNVKNELFDAMDPCGLGLLYSLTIRGPSFEWCSHLLPPKLVYAFPLGVHMKPIIPTTLPH
jgi:hypothetical protein